MGTRTSRQAIRYKSRDHPHAYGDKCFLVIFVKYSIGSSPRVWGQAFAVTNATYFSGIIPTRMGTRERHSQTFFVIEDHPHAYGDKIYLTLSLWCHLGSSPRVWGQGDRRRSPRGVDWDHPHAYGDKDTVAV